MIKHLARAGLGVATAVILGLGLSVAAVTPTVASAAACQITVAHPNISIHEDAQYVSYPFTNKCGTNVYYASWEVVGPSSWDDTSIDTPNANLTYYDWLEGKHLGGYKLVPNYAYDANYNDVSASQATEYFTVKLGARISIAGYRSGNYVYLHAYETRYNPDVSSFVPAYGGTVTFWGKRWGGSWWNAPTVTTGANGWTKYVKVFAPAAHYFRAIAAETAYRWGATSATIWR